MSGLVISRALRQAMKHLAAGELAPAEALYRQILDREPGQPDALHFLGVIALQVGRHDVAIDLIGRAAALDPKNPKVHSNLGEAYRQQHRPEEAIASFGRALALQPDFPDALNNLAAALTEQKRLDEAAANCRRALRLRPDFAQAHYNLGVILTHQARPGDAIAAFQRAIKLKPDFAAAHNNLGNVFKDTDRLDQAMACHHRALAIDPNLTEAHNNLALLCEDRGQFDEALASYQTAAALAPEDAEIQKNLGNLCVKMGRLDETVACFRRALALDSSRADIHSSLLFAQYYRHGDDPGEIAAETRRWNERHAEPLARFIRRPANDPSPDRPLRIGYLSPDLRRHPVAYFLLPLLQAHDHGQFHVTGYATGTKSDEITALLRAATAEWRDLANLSDEAAAEKIRADQIDILVDLAGHTADNRLLIFARQPAPVQVSHLGYPGSTGLATIDGRFSDAWADPPGSREEPGAGQPVRLPDTAWCFTPLSGRPPVAPLPALRRGCLTYGCFNNFPKITDDILHLWARILREVPGSRLALKNQAMHTPSVVGRLRNWFENASVSPSRLELIPQQASPLDHLRRYDDVDIALDTFPYHGTTTTCEALWMGVPVITLAGREHVARVGVSLLTNAGLPEFVARTPADYAATAVALASDLNRLGALRAELRGRVEQSPLMDGPRYARHVEAAYRALWRRRCAQSS